MARFYNKERLKKNKLTIDLYLHNDFDLFISHIKCQPKNIYYNIVTILVNEH